METTIRLGNVVFTAVVWSAACRLMLAASLGKLDPVRELRRLGASYDLRDNGGSTALHWACISKNPQLVEWMVVDGANVSATNHLGRTPLMQLGRSAVLWGRHSPGVSDPVAVTSTGYFHQMPANPRRRVNWGYLDTFLQERN